MLVAENVFKSREGKALPSDREVGYRFASGVGSHPGEDFVGGKEGSDRLEGRVKKERQPVLSPLSFFLCFFLESEEDNLSSRDP